MNQAAHAAWRTDSRPGVVEGLRRVAGRELDPLLWQAACLDRIAARDPLVMAWAHVVDETSLEPTLQSVRGVLHGLPIGVKDVIDVAAMPTGCGSPAMDGFVADADAAAVARLKAAGAVVLGKTVTTEFAFMRAGPTRNPLDPARTPGGSSSGSAAAVADGHVPVALTTQTGGSTIRPAAYCGIVGYKPPVGTVPLAGLRILDPNMDTIGLHARSVADIARVASVLEARPREPNPAERVNILVTGLGQGPGADMSNTHFLMRCGARLRESGASVVDIELPFDRATLDDCHRTIMSAAVARSFADLFETKRDLLSTELCAFIERGRRHGNDELADARARVERAREAIGRVCGHDSVLIWPSATGEAPIGLAATGDSSLNRPWSLLGYGVMTVPAGAGPAGMPLGLQIIDPQPGAPLLFAAAFAAETAFAATQSRE